MNIWKQCAGFCEWVSSNVTLLWGIWQVQKLKEPRVTFFGGSRAKLQAPYAKSARALARLCAEHGITILTGGGPGIMEAAGCSLDGYEYSLGIGVRGLIAEHEPNGCQSKMVIVENFPTRKWLLMEYSQAFVIFPGGYGTLDEAFALLTLVQTGFLPRLPIIFFDSVYWQPIISWINDKAIPAGLVVAPERELFIVTDDVQEAFATIYQSCAAKK